MLHDHLTYMHSSGHSQTKGDVLHDLAGTTFFASLVYSDRTFEVVNNVGIATLTVDQVKNLPGGKTRASRLKVLQTWLETHGSWQMLTRTSALISSSSITATCPK